MTDETPHAVRRSRHVGGDHEIVCRCGFVAKGAKARAEADFDAHVRIERLRREAPVVARGMLARLSEMAQRLSAGLAGRIG